MLLPLFVIAEQCIAFVVQLYVPFQFLFRDGDALDGFHQQIGQMAVVIASDEPQGFAALVWEGINQVQINHRFAVGIYSIEDEIYNIGQGK